MQNKAMKLYLITILHPNFYFNIHNMHFHNNHNTKREFNCGKNLVVPRILEEICISASNHCSLKFIVYVSLHNQYANLYYLYFHYFLSFWV